MSPEVKPTLESETGTSLMVPVSEPPGSPAFSWSVVGAFAAESLSSVAEGGGAAAAGAAAGAAAWPYAAALIIRPSARRLSKKQQRRINFIVFELLEFFVASGYAFQIAFLLKAAGKTKIMPIKLTPIPTSASTMRP